jgi:hypothetical protein
MNRVLLTLAVIGGGSLLSPSGASAQLLPPAAKTTHVQITQGPELELANGYLTIIRWTTNNPGGSDEHFGVGAIRYRHGKISHQAEPGSFLHGLLFRVRLNGLKTKTTYYYRVTSIGSDGEEGAVNRFVSPAPARSSPRRLRRRFLSRDKLWMINGGVRKSLKTSE